MAKIKKIFRIAAHGLVKKNGKFLVTKRSLIDDYMPGYWDVPGGDIKFGEDVSKALSREFSEETGLKIKAEKIILAYGYLSGKHRHQFQLVYACRFVSGKIKLNPKDHSEFRWVTLKELKKLKKIAFLKALVKVL